MWTSISKQGFKVLSTQKKLATYMSQSNFGKASVFGNVLQTSIKECGSG